MSVLRYAGMASLAVAAMAAGFWLASAYRPAEVVHAPGVQHDFQGHALNPPRRISVPALLKDDGSAFSKADITGHWSLVFFGYTHCPDVCPAAMNTLAAAKKAAAEKSSGRPFPQVIFVSVDPQRDSIDLLREYVRYFDPDFTGVTGEERLIRALTLQTSVVYMKMPMEGSDSTGDNYLVDHSSAILLLDPQGRLAAFLKQPHTPQSILDSLDKLIGADASA